MESVKNDALRLRSATGELVKYSKKEFVELYNPVICLRKLGNITSIQQAICSEVPTLYEVKKQFGEDWTIDFIQLWLDNLNNYLNIKNKWTATQINEVSILIFNRYKSLNIADLHLFFSKVKCGDYGSLYDSIDGVKVLSWLDKYADQRAEAYIEKTNDDAKYKHSETHVINAYIDSIIASELLTIKEKEKRIKQLDRFQNFGVNTKKSKEELMNQILESESKIAKLKLKKQSDELKSSPAQ